MFSTSKGPKLYLVLIIFRVKLQKTLTINFTKIYKITKFQNIIEKL